MHILNVKMACNGVDLREVGSLEPSRKEVDKQQVRQKHYFGHNTHNQKK